MRKWINATAILVDVQVVDWQESVRKSGELLVGEGFVEPRYIEAMIETTKELGAYCVIAPGIAIPHARPEMGVKKTGYAAVALSNPVEFGNPDNDPVSLVLGFCALDHTSHIESLTLMARAISSEGFLDRVKQACDEKDLERILNNVNGK